MRISIPSSPLGKLAAAGAALLLVLPAAAQTGRASGRPGSAGGSPGIVAGNVVEGVVTSVLPTAGFAAGQLVALLGGLVTIDLSGAEVKRLAHDGTPEAGTVAVGDRIAALLKDPGTTGGRLVALAAFVYAEPVAATVRGDLDSVDASAKSFVLLGLAIRATPSTVFGGEGVSGLADLRKGDPVVATVQSGSFGLQAQRVVRTSSVPMPGEHEVQRIQGWVNSIGPDAWTLRTGPASSLAPLLLLRVDASTRYFGNPKVGDEVEVLATKPATGPPTAILIAKAGMASGTM